MCVHARVYICVSGVHMCECVCVSVCVFSAPLELGRTKFITLSKLEAFIQALAQGA